MYVPIIQIVKDCGNLDLLNEKIEIGNVFEICSDICDGIVESEENDKIKEEFLYYLNNLFGFTVDYEENSFIFDEGKFYKTLTKNAEDNNSVLGAKAFAKEYKKRAYEYPVPHMRIT